MHMVLTGSCLVYWNNCLFRETGKVFFSQWELANLVTLLSQYIVAVLGYLAPKARILYCVQKYILAKPVYYYGYSQRSERFLNCSFHLSGCHFEKDEACCRPATATFLCLDHLIIYFFTSVINNHYYQMFLLEDLFIHYRVYCVLFGPSTKLMDELLLKSGSQLTTFLIW
jgi:hypothetical protein